MNRTETKTKRVNKRKIKFNLQTGIQKDRYTAMQRRTKRQKDIKTERQKDRKTERLTKRRHKMAILFLVSFSIVNI
jgi:hypothetical protein